MSDPITTADIQLIQKILPHRYPFLLVDKVHSIDGTSSAVGIKNVTMNEPHFQGHFPGNPIMPGVTIIEAMAQTSAVMVGASNGSSLDIASFSNFGSRLDAHGWGFNVTTSGYGGLYNGGTLETYTSTFSGTSSATPIVTNSPWRMFKK